MITHTASHQPAATHARGRRTISAALVVGALGAAAAAAIAARVRRGSRYDPLDSETWPSDTLAFSG
jgi:hypothetical protein